MPSPTPKKPSTGTVGLRPPHRSSGAELIWGTPALPLPPVSLSLPEPCATSAWTSVGSRTRLNDSLQGCGWGVMSGLLGEMGVRGHMYMTPRRRDWELGHRGRTCKHHCPTAPSYLNLNPRHAWPACHTTQSTHVAT